ncbi:unnamed protein product [Candidula unifasciata]|uniref:Endoglucanase n=1 Tax=Candidula unifasciata TaxID=100452 RepID=A0A8S3YSH8_9EUPU|nr:unnamed protein product [Candidula unifasciata]
MLYPWVLGLLLPLLLAISDGAKNYHDALGKSILFYDAQRSGKLPANNPIPWRGDSAVNDCVPGGWYDAGDHIKFGLPLSYTVTILGWSLVRYKDGYEEAGELDNMYDMIKWAYDYLLKAMGPQQTASDCSVQLTVQVGDGDLDHDFWGRAEDMTMARPCKVVSTSTKGSDIAGGTGDTSYANQLLSAAKSLYTFAKSHRGLFHGSDEFYASSGDKDDMCEGAIWLYKATNDAQYLTDAKSFVETDTAWAYEWDDKMVGCQGDQEQPVQRGCGIVLFTDGWLPSGDIDYTPCGLAWRDKWGSLGYSGSAAYIALVAADLGIQPAKLRQFAVEQINYILGDNKHDGGCYSYEIGYGSKYPLRPHHSGASCPNRPASCDFDQLDAPGPNPHVLTGAVVGGPDSNDNYKDDRNDYVQNEVALDYNAGFHAALAGIAHLQSTNQMPTTHNKCPCSQ